MLLAAIVWITIQGNVMTIHKCAKVDKPVIVRESVSKKGNHVRVELTPCKTT